MPEAMGDRTRDRPGAAWWALGICIGMGLAVGGCTAEQGDATMLHQASSSTGGATALARSGNDHLIGVDHARAGMPLPAGADPQAMPIRVSRQAALTAARTGELTVALPDGSRYEVRHESNANAPGGNWTFVGRVATELGPLASVITFGKDSVFGTLPTPDGRMLQITTFKGQALLQPAGGILPPGTTQASIVSDMVLPPDARRGQSRARTAQPPAASRAMSSLGSQPIAVAAPSGLRLAPATTALEPVTVDVLGIYTANLSAVRGSAAAAETEFTNLVAVANQAHIDSGSVVRLALVGLRETDVPGSAFNRSALDLMEENQLPDGLDVHGLRNELAADLVTMLRPYTSHDPTCGIANLAGAGLRGETPDPERGYAVVATVSCGPLVLAHETGHNLGSAHDIETETLPYGGYRLYGAYPFSFGYRRFDPGIATVMAYGLPGQQPLGLFSHPGTTLCQGAACGIADQADNVRSLNLMAHRVSRFRDPVNTVSILGGSALESDVTTADLVFTVRSSSPAPAGGILFDVESIAGGTATPGVDFDALFMADVLIPEGATTATLKLTVHPDTEVEGDETLLLEISNVRGMPLHQSLVESVIRDDDPRARIRGQVVFPPGSKAPGSSIDVYTDANLYGVSEWVRTVVPPPEFRYDIDVPNGAVVYVDTSLPEPFLFQDIDIGTVVGDRKMDIETVVGVPVRGRITWPAGAEAPTEPIDLLAWNIKGTAWGHYVATYPPDYGFELLGWPGANVNLSVQAPPAPWVAQNVAVGFLDEPVDQDIELRTVPSLNIEHAAWQEGASNAQRTETLFVDLSDRAPAGGITFDIETSGGTATPGGDYVEMKTTRLHVPEGALGVMTGVTTYGDDIPEPDESFSVVISNVEGGAWAPNAGRSLVWILDDDRRPPPADIDGDGVSDILWRNQAHGQNIAWLGGSATTPLAMVGVRNLQWKVAGIGDFDGDGEADVFWRNMETGGNIAWRSADASAPLLTGNASPAWVVGGIGDFNGNGTADILWRNPASGANVFWESGTAGTPTGVTAVPGASWRVGAIGDFDGDGRDDVLWRNHVTGGNVLWGGADSRSPMTVAGLANLDWEIAGIGDLGGDGRDDVVWRNAVTGAVVAWRSADSGQAQVLGNVALAWHVAAVGDYDGDGQADLLWRNGETGANVAWRSGDRGQAVLLARVGDMAWAIVP